MDFPSDFYSSSRSLQKPENSFKRKDGSKDIKPLPARIRPKSFDELLGNEGVVSRLRPGQSAIFWGPPGSGKTTLALLLAKESDLPLRRISATTDGIGKLREVIGERAIVFVDEIHRWNKAQQDALLPYVEEGDIVLLGATTENPGHYINRALLSRAELYKLEPLSEENVVLLLRRGLQEFPEADISDSDLRRIAAWSEGDARRALHALEEILLRDNREDIDKILPEIPAENEHYHLASALIKSMRGGDPQAALYWLARMESSGEDPRFLARRMVIFASEDVGLARSGAVAVAESIASVVERIGEPECWISLAHGVCYLARAPKSRHAYDGLQRAREAVRTRPHYPVPDKIRHGNKITEQFGEGVGYSIDDQDGFLPPPLEGEKFLRGDNS